MKTHNTQTTHNKTIQSENTEHTNTIENQTQQQQATHNKTKTITKQRQHTNMNICTKHMNKTQTRN